MKVGVVVFPGSNCDHDAYHVVKHVAARRRGSCGTRTSDLSGLDAVILPGGFSYGDYLRTGAIARFSPVMRAVGEFAARGGPVLGICNGFQILQEAGLLPGAMLRNRAGEVPVPARARARGAGRHDRHRGRSRSGTVLTMPIAHGEGNFYLPDEELDRLEGEGQVVFRYTTRGRRASRTRRTPTAARARSRACATRRGNVVGLMPHPERAAERGWARRRPPRVRGHDPCPPARLRRHAAVWFAAGPESGIELDGPAGSASRPARAIPTCCSRSPTIQWKTDRREWIGRPVSRSRSPLRVGPRAAAAPASRLFASRGAGFLPTASLQAAMASCRRPSCQSDSPLSSRATTRSGRSARAWSRLASASSWRPRRFRIAPR